MGERLGEDLPQMWSWFQSTPVALWILCCGLGTLLELAFRTAPATTDARSSRRLNARYGVVHACAILLLAPLCNVAVDATTRMAGWKVFDGFEVTRFATLNQILAVFAFILSADFFYYWWHRTQHASTTLWGQHAVHHSDETVNATTTMRQHWSEFVFQSFLVTLPVVMLVRIDPATMVTASIVMNVWSVFNHLDVRLPLGPLGYAVSGPRYHRLHHSTRAEHRDCNFAAYFPIWDIIFGTFRAPGRDDYDVPTGLASGERMETVLRLSAWPLSNLLEILRTRREDGTAGRR